jgi:hypothetical protein
MQIVWRGEGFVRSLAVLIIVENVDLGLRFGLFEVLGISGLRVSKM